MKSSLLDFSSSGIDASDLRLLAELDLNCRTSSVALAKKIGKSRQSVEYRIKRLLEEQVITGFNTTFSPTKMGYRLYKIYLKLRHSEREKRELRQYLSTAGHVYWLGECSGSWDLLFGIFYRTESELFWFTNDLASKFNPIIVGEHGHMMVDALQYPKMYFTGEIQPPKDFAGEVVTDPKLEALEYGILSVLVNNARIAVSELAESVNVSPVIVRNRLARLQELGIIVQYRIGVDLMKLGLELYKVIIEVDRYTKDDEQRLLNLFSSIPNIQYFVRNIWQIEAELIVRSYSELSEIVNKIKQAFPLLIRRVDCLLMLTDEWTHGFRNILSAGTASTGSCKKSPPIAA